jgi:preprotein translocase subunit SecA
MQWFKKLVTGGERDIKQLQKTVAQIDSFEAEHRKVSDEYLRGSTERLRERYNKGESLDAMLPEAFSLVREAMGRAIGKRHFAVQMIGGIVLHQGRIAEMKTGEGKTFVAILPAFLNSLPKDSGTHIVTVNDYLAKFQGEWMSHVLRLLGMSVGVITNGMTNDERRNAYLADITYGTNSEFGFDYLRDNMVIYKDKMVQRGHPFAIIDEADSILIDEARTPLIISGSGEKSSEMYARADQFVSRMKLDADYLMDEKQKTINLTEEGVTKAERHFRLENLADAENSLYNHHINNALRANFLMKREREYIVQNDEVLIVDEFTGRIMKGRRFSDGLHQAIEAKEHVKIKQENKTLATITIQNYFRMYKKLAGMTGTAKTEEAEFNAIYNLDIVQIPTNKQMIRKDLNDMIYTQEKPKYEAVADEIERRHKTGQPLLVGTVSVEKSEYLSRILERRGIKHEVLNAKHHAREAEIVAQAGHYGSVTIATNMAGRGTDILLGGNPEFLARLELRKQGVAEEVIDLAVGHEEGVADEVSEARKNFRRLEAEFKKQTDAEHDKVVAVGGLHIIGTERHESRRIDNQLRGRAGRQGDPGSSQFFMSLQDDLMRLFGSERIQPMIERLNQDPNQPLELGLLTKQIENAQKMVEGRHFQTRKSVLQYDDVMNQQRGIIYGQRRQVLDGEDMRLLIGNMIHTLVEDAVNQFASGEDSDNWNLAELSEFFSRYFLGKNWITEREAELKALGARELIDRFEAEAVVFYKNKEEEIAKSKADMRELERIILLRNVDKYWMDHIDAMDQLRSGIGLRALGQKDPIAEYKIEGFEMFDEMVRLIRENTLADLFRVRLTQNAPQPVRRAAPHMTNVRTNVSASSAKTVESVKKAFREVEKVGRNDPCPCGSGKKYKQCCGK